MFHFSFSPFFFRAHFSIYVPHTAPLFAFCIEKFVFFWYNNYIRLPARGDFMLMPRYYFADDFRSFYEYFLSQPHTKRTFQKGDYLWKPGQPYDRIQYYVSGTSMLFSDHESGDRKIISFHGPGTILPGYHTTDFRIERSLTTVAISEIKLLEFTIPQFKEMFDANAALAECVVNWYSKYVNRFLFETIHQEFNSSQ